MGNHEVLWITATTSIMIWRLAVECGRGDVYFSNDDKESITDWNIQEEEILALRRQP